MQQKETKEGKEIKNEVKAIRLIYLSDEYNQFYEELDETTKGKVDRVINYIRENKNLSHNFVKKLKKSKTHQYEIIVTSTNKRAYRILCIGLTDENLVDAEEILLLNGFLKKDDKKDYKGAMKKADRIIENFFDKD